MLCYENTNFCCFTFPTASHECRPNTAAVPHLQLCHVFLLLMLHRDQLEPPGGLVVIPCKLQLMKTVQPPSLLCEFEAVCVLCHFLCSASIKTPSLELCFLCFSSPSPSSWQLQQSGDERPPLVVSYQVPSQLVLHGRWESFLKGFSLHLITGVQREWGVCRRVGGEWRHEANYKGSEWENESRRRWHSRLETSKCWLLFK